MVPKLTKYDSINRNALLLADKGDNAKKRYVNQKRAIRLDTALKKIQKAHPVINNVMMDLHKIEVDCSNKNALNQIIELFKKYCIQFKVINDLSETIIDGLLHPAIQLKPFLQLVRDSDPQARVVIPHSDPAISYIPYSSEHKLSFHFDKYTANLAAETYSKIDSIYEYDEGKDKVNIIRKHESDGALL
jgi:hypothetical protein